jgi:hypothetical protein
MESAGNGYSRQNQIGLAMDSLGKLTRQTGGGAGALIPFVRFDRIRRQVKQKFNLDKLLTYRFRWTAPWPLGLGDALPIGVGSGTWVGLERPPLAAVSCSSSLRHRDAGELGYDWKRLDSGRLEGKDGGGEAEFRFVSSTQTQLDDNPAFSFSPVLKQNQAQPQE